MKQLSDQLITFISPWLRERDTRELLRCSTANFAAAVDGNNESRAHGIGSRAAHRWFTASVERRWRARGVRAARQRVDVWRRQATGSVMTPCFAERD
jgi:hypothetical protein